MKCIYFNLLLLSLLECHAPGDDRGVGAVSEETQRHPRLDLKVPNKSRVSGQQEATDPGSALTQGPGPRGDRHPEDQGCHGCGKTPGT